MRKIVAFAGSKQAGKTTAFSTIKNQFTEVHEVTIAGKLKNVVGEVLNIDTKNFHVNELKEVPFEDPITITKEQIEAVITAFNLEFDYDKHVRPHVGTLIETPRQSLQFFGTNVLHPIDDLVHIKNAVAGMPKRGIVVVTDLRFLQEFEYFRDTHKEEFFPFYIKNNKAELMAEGDTHPSETDLQKFKNQCTLIDNNGSLDAYKLSLVTNLQSIL